MKKIVLLQIMALLVLQGCESAPAGLNDDNFKHSTDISRWPFFSIQTDISFTEEILREDGSRAFLTYDSFATKRNSEDIAVYIYPLQQEACSRDITGSSNLRELVGQDNIVWGEVDIWKEIGFEGFDDYAALASVKCYRDDFSDHEFIYTMCSQKDERTVVICITQQKNNPQLAEEIFRTFKWTE